MGFNRVLMGRSVSYTPLPIASGYSAMLAVMSVTLALMARKLGANGEKIEIPIAAACCEALIYNSMGIEDFPGRYRCLREHEIARRKATGEKMNLSYNAVKELLDPFFHTYECSDGRMFYLVASSNAVHQERVLQALGLWEEVQHIPQGMDAVGFIRPRAVP